ncbi:hypothetical protein [Paenibacillus sp. NPDC093718]|uniref:hypothetical protein n=1 Tax=Paenibacillus sp. NPDC093718 TaxID=3390601 RepID=UPI003CFD9474
METYSFTCEAVTNFREVKKVIARHESKMKSPCYVSLLTDKGVKNYYAEKSNLSLKDAGWIVVEKREDSNTDQQCNILPIEG